MAKTPADQLQELRELTSNGTARDIRLAARLSQSDIARSIGVDASTVARWERGERLPRGTAAMSYARLLNRLARPTATATAS